MVDPADAQVDSDLQFLVRYVDLHFLCEEDVMKRTGFEGFDHHRKLHEQMRNELMDIAESHRNGASFSGVCARIHVFFTEWYRLHISETDRILVHHLRKTGMMQLNGIP